jgi:phosphoribosylformylglycinamidine (FGAM) synthase PurS component
MTPETEFTSNEKHETVESHNSELTGKIELPPTVTLSDLGAAKLGIEIKPTVSDPAGLALKDFPEIKKYPVVPDPAAVVASDETGEAKETESVITPRPSDRELVELAKAALDASGFLENASKSEFIQDQLAKGGLTIDRVSLGKFLEFRAEVLRAFKHLGLDVKKHFTE